MDGRVSGQANKPISRPAHAITGDVLQQELKADVNLGLSDNEVKLRLAEYGRNELEDGPGVQPLKILIAQIANAMMLVRI